jgi:hypothetical protein
MPMRLLDLNPRWFVLEEGGPIVGLGFQCPHCLIQRLSVLFHHSGASAAGEDQYIRAHHGGAADRFIWDLPGQQDFETLTLTPSIDASKSGHWHGFITGGEIK